MTPIRYHPAPRWRESNSITREAGRIRVLALALEPEAILLRPKGTRQTLRLPIGIAYQLAARLEADRRRRERAEARKGKRQERS